jgi:uncharacterized protein YggE
LARVQLGVMTSGPNVDVAAEESNQIIQAVMEAVTQTGVDAVDMQTSGFNVWSEELYPQDSPESSGDGPVEPRTIYRVENTVNVTVRDVDTLGDVIQSGLDAGANRVWGVEFSIEDTTQLEQEARANAVDEARARAADLAEEMGVGLGDVVSIVESPAGLPFSTAEGAYGLGGGGGGPPISSGQMNVSVLVRVTFEIS